MKKKHKHKSKHKHKNKKDKKKRSEKICNKDIKVKTPRIEKDEEETIHLPSNKVFIEDVPGLTPEKAFRKDRKPDLNNIIYGCIYKMNVAKYRTVSNIVLGLKPGHYIILSEKYKSKDKFREPRYYGKENRLTKAQERSVIDMSKPVLEQKREKFGIIVGNVIEEYIPISKTVRKLDGEKTDYNPLGIYDSSTELYVQGKGKMALQEETDEGDIYRDTPEKLIQNKTAEYNSYLHENPNDEDRWLEFINFQDEVVSMRQLEEEEDGVKQKKKDDVILEIKASVMEKAVEKNPASVRLKIKQLNMCCDIWERSKLSKEWKQLTFRHPNDPYVWWYYLQYVKAHFNTFTVSSVAKAYTKCLTTLQSVATGTMQTHKPFPHTEEHIIG